MNVSRSFHCDCYFDVVFFHSRINGTQGSFHQHEQCRVNSTPAHDLHGSQEADDPLRSQYF